MSKSECKKSALVQKVRRAEQSIFIMQKENMKQISHQPYLNTHITVEQHSSSNTDRSGSDNQNATSRSISRRCSSASSQRPAEPVLNRHMFTEIQNNFKRGLTNHFMKRSASQGTILKESKQTRGCKTTLGGNKQNLQQNPYYQSNQLLNKSTLGGQSGLISGLSIGGKGRGRGVGFHSNSRERSVKLTDLGENFKFKRVMKRTNFSEIDAKEEKIRKNSKLEKLKNQPELWALLKEAEKECRASLDELQNGVLDLYTQTINKHRNPLSQSQSHCEIKSKLKKQNDQLMSEPDEQDAQLNQTKQKYLNFHTQLEDDDCLSQDPQFRTQAQDCQGKYLHKPEEQDLPEHLSDQKINQYDSSPSQMQDMELNPYSSHPDPIQIFIKHPELKESQRQLEDNHDDVAQEIPSSNNDSIQKRMTQELIEESNQESDSEAKQVQLFQKKTRFCKQHTQSVASVPQIIGKKMQSTKLPNENMSRLKSSLIKGGFNKTAPPGKQNKEVNPNFVKDCIQIEFDSLNENYQQNPKKKNDEQQGQMSTKEKLEKENMKIQDEFETFSARMRKVFFLDRNGRQTYSVAYLTATETHNMIRDFNASGTIGSLDIGHQNTEGMINYSVSTKNLKLLIKNVKTLIDANVCTDQKPTYGAENSLQQDNVHVGRISIKKPKTQQLTAKQMLNAKVILYKGKTVLNPISKESWDMKLTAIYKVLEKACDIFTIGNKSEWHMLYWVVRTHGLIALEFKDFAEAARVFKKLKGFCRTYKAPAHHMVIIRQLAYIYKELKLYKKALKCYKKLLYIAWYADDYKNELTAYEGIALQYFYLNETEKAKHYQERVLRGKSENNKSVVKQVARDIVAQYYKPKNEDSQDVKEKGSSFERVPSPSAYAKPGASNAQISLLPYFTEAEEIKMEKEKKIETVPVGPSFTRSELLYLNQQPDGDYLKINQKISTQEQLKARSKSAQAAGKDTQMKNGIFYQKRPNREEVLTHDAETHFKKIVSRAWSRCMDVGETAPQILHHHSRVMMNPLDNFNTSTVANKIRALIFNLEQRLDFD